MKCPCCSKDMVLTFEDTDVYRRKYGSILAVPNQYHYFNLTCPFCRYRQSWKVSNPMRTKK